MENYTKYRLKDWGELADLLEDKDNLFVIACNKCYKEYGVEIEPELDTFVAFCAEQGKTVTGKLTAYNVKKKTLAIDGTTYKMAGWYDKNTTITKYETNGGAVGDEVGILLSDDNVIIALWKV